MLICYFLFDFFFVILVKEVLMSPKGNLRQKLEEIFKLMLMLWCRQCQVSKLVAPEPCGKTDTVNYSLTKFSLPFIY